MIYLLFFILFAAAMSIVLAWFADNDGVVSLVWLGYQIDTTVMFIAVSLSVALTFTAVVIFWLSRKSAKRLVKRNDKMLHQLARSYAAIEHGDIKQAKQSADKVARLIRHRKNHHPLVHILRAKIAQGEKSDDKAIEHYTELLNYPETQMQALEHLVKYDIAAGKFRKAIKMSEDALQKNPKDEVLLTLLLGLYKQVEDWEAFDKKLETIKKKKRTWSGDKVLDWHHEKAVACLMLAREKCDDDAALRWSLLEEGYKTAPEFVPILLDAMSMCEKLGKQKRLSALIEKSWVTIPHPVLGRWYVEQGSPTDIQKTRRAAKLWKLNKDHYESSMLMAESYVMCEDYDVVESHLSDAIMAVGGEDYATKRLCDAWLAYLSTVENRDVEQDISRWEERAEYARQGAAFKCSSCGESHAQWSIDCDACHSKDTLVWAEVKSGHNVQLVAS